MKIKEKIEDIILNLKKEISNLFINIGKNIGRGESSFSSKGISKKELPKINAVPIEKKGDRGYTVRMATSKEKWISFILCLFFGLVGAHKFYEGKKAMGFLYMFTGGLFVVGWARDLILIFRSTTRKY